MKKLILLVAVLSVTGCDGGLKSPDALLKYRDKENGVICYQDPDEWKAFSCVKVSGGENE